MQRKSSVKSASSSETNALQQYVATEGHFSLARNFRLADLVTIMNGVCGSFSIFSSARYLLTNDPDYLWSALMFPLAGLMFDFLDGKVARWRKSSSMLGQELDSLADLISFGVAPALVAFVVGLRTYLDTVVLTGFICCGLARLARFNATVALVPKNEEGKAKYFEGLPIPSSLALVGILSYWTKQGWIEGKEGIPFGVVKLWGLDGGSGEIHRVSFVFALWAAAMVSLMVTSGDIRRLFCQSILSRGILSEKLAKTIWTNCIQVVREADDSIKISSVQSDEDWDTFISSVNQTLDDLDFEFKLCHDQVSGRKTYALVNRKGDDVAQLATDYTAVEIAYFKAIVEQIMLAPDETFSISSFAALREASEIKPKTNISKTQAETTLNSFVAKGWLLRSKRGRFSLSTRTMLELGAYIRSTYSEEVLECTICSDMVTKGVACLTANCKVRMHNHCFTLCRRKRHTCPSCNANWPAESKDLVPVGEAAARDRDEARRRPRQDANDSEQDNSQAQSTKSKRRQGSRKSKGRKVQMDVDDSDEDQLEDDD